MEAEQLTNLKLEMTKKLIEVHDMAQMIVQAEGFKDHESETVYAFTSFFVTAIDPPPGIDPQVNDLRTQELMMASTTMNATFMSMVRREKALYQLLSKTIKKDK